MRQLLVTVAQDRAEELKTLAEQHEARHLVTLESGQSQVLFVHLPNERVQGFLEELEEADVTLIPRGVLTFHAPSDEVPDHVTDLGKRSPTEVYLSGLQAVGSWPGFLGYATVGGMLAWMGLYTNSVVLQIGAMLIAPFAEPAMNLGLATARGDARLARQSLTRYAAGLAVAILVAFLLSLVLSQELATLAMIQASKVSSVAVLLPLLAGSAGALNLVQPDRSSLVGGTATGMLIAAALAPPAGVLGMALALGKWSMVHDAAFVLLLQLVGINLAGGLVFRGHGLSPRSSRYARGRESVFRAGVALTVLALGGLLAWQFSSSPALQHDSIEQQVAADVERVIAESGLAHLLETEVRFTRTSIPGQTSLLITGFVQSTGSGKRVAATLERAVEARLQERYNLTPLVKLTVLAPPKSNRNM